MNRGRWVSVLWIAVAALVGCATPEHARHAKLLELLAIDPQSHWTAATLEEQAARVFPEGTLYETVKQRVDATDPRIEPASRAPSRGWSASFTPQQIQVRSWVRQHALGGHFWIVTWDFASSKCVSSDVSFRLIGIP